MSVNQVVRVRPVARGVLVRYRIMAYLTAFFLLLLVFVAIPIQIWGHDKTMEAIVGQIHGFLYMVYLVSAFEITVKLRIPLSRLVLVLLAGTIPFGSFVAERAMTHAWQRRERAVDAAIGGAGSLSGQAQRQHAGGAGDLGEHAEGFR